MSNRRRIALVQMVSSKFVDRNMVRLDELVREAGSADVQAIFLPENFGALAADNPRDIAERQASPEGELRSVISGLARELSVWIFAGTMPMSARPDGSVVEGGRVRAASIVYDADGRERARYDKIHMFDVDVNDGHRRYLESAAFEPGDDIVIVSTPIGKVGLTVCYDLRFPEIYRELFIRGAQVFAVPSAFTRPTGAAHFELLLRARAVENFTFAVAACQGGVHDSGRETWGHSMVVDPWGEILCKARGEGEDIVIADLDFERQAAIRRDMPVLSQRRIS